MINCLIFKKKSHILTIFNEIKLSFNNKNILKRFYTLTECECRISRFENYYKHYLKYLLKPILRNYYFNNLIHERANQKAQNYFNLAYGHKLNNNNNNINNEKEINDIIIFNDSIKETIENYSTTITCESKEQLVYPSEIYKKCLEDNKMHNKNSLIINRINNIFSESEILLNSNKSNFIIQNENDSIINMLKFLTKKKNSNKKIIKQKSINNILEKPEKNKRKAISKSNPKKIKRFSNDKNDSLREKSKRKKENKNNFVNNYNNIKSNNNNNQKNVNNNIKQILNYNNKENNKNKENNNNNIKQKNKNENSNSKKISFIHNIPNELNSESKKLNLIKKVKKNYNKSLSNTIEMKKNIIKYQNIQKSNIDNLLNNNNYNNIIYNNNPNNIIYNQYNKNSLSTRFKKHSNISGDLIKTNKTNNNNNNNLNCFTTLYILNKRLLSALNEKKKTFSKSLVKITKDKIRNNNNYFNSFNFNLTETKNKNLYNNNNDNDSLFLKHKKIQTAPNITNDDNNNLYKSSQFQKHNNIKKNISNSNLHYYKKLKKRKTFFP